MVLVVVVVVMVSPLCCLIGEIGLAKLLLNCGVLLLLLVTVVVKWRLDGTGAGDLATILVLVSVVPRVALVGEIGVV